MKKHAFAKSLIGVAATLLLAAPFAGAADEDPPPLSTGGGGFGTGGGFVHQDGRTLFRAICQGCHMPDAKGAKGAGMYPALAENPKLASAAYLAITVMKGRHGMPPFGSMLTDAQIAAVVNYVRTNFGNHYTDVLTADDVKKFR
jgi:cytochrome c5